MHLRTTFFLLVLTLLIASLVVVDQSSDNNGNEQAKALTKLLEFEPERVVTWSFTSDQGSIECRNDHGQWVISQPLKTRAKDARVNYMLAVLSSLPRREMITEAQRKARSLALADYGLEKPAVRIVLGSPDKRLTINVGNLSPLKDSVYVRLDESDTVIATATNLLAIIPRDLAAIRDTQLLRGAPAYAKKIEIKRPQSPFILAVKEGPEWILHKPIMTRADWLKISGFLDALFNAQIEQYVSDTMTEPALYGLSDDEATLQIGVWQNESAGGEYLIFGKKADAKGAFIYAYVRGQNSVFTVKAEVFEALNAGLSNLRDSRLFFMAPEAFAAIRIEEGFQVLQLVRGPQQGWQITEPKKWKADDQAVESLIGRLNALRIEKVLPAAGANALSLEKPAKTIAVAAAAPSPATRILQLSLPAQSKEYVLGRFRDEEEIYHLSATAIATISLNPMSYRDSTVLTIAPAAVRKIILKKDKAEQVLARDDKGAWQALQPAGAQPDQTAIHALCAKAADLHALRFESAEGATANMYGLQSATRTLTFNLSGQESISKTIIFGENSEDKGVYAMLQGQEFVFVLAKELADALQQDLVKIDADLRP